MSAHTATARLYTFPLSLWAGVPRLLIAENNIPDIDLVNIDLSKGENFGPQYIAVSSESTVPALEVVEGDKRVKVLTDSTTVTEYLNTLGSTHLPTEGTEDLINAMHGKYDVGNPLFFTSGSVEELNSKKGLVAPFLQGRIEGWINYKKSAPQHSHIYDVQIANTQELLAFYTGADPSPMFAQNKQLWEVANEFLDTVESQLKGDYLVGEYSLADVHFTPYLHRLLLLRPEALFEHRPQLKAYYERVKARSSYSII
ncbi:hypothetical protein BDF14DRAFT_5412 [Spinellus fusiger]|nr:hypothetical protein BDF14DRAFT_5412 [Spinellus fusiger]